MRVALIESRSRTCHDLVTMLEENGIEATEISNAFQLSSVLQADDISVIIIGEPQPESKVEIIRSIRNHPRSVRVGVIGVVADIDGPEAATLIENGADDVIALPITSEDLGETDSAHVLGEVVRTG